MEKAFSLPAKWLSLLFTKRATNPYAPEYHPTYWNDAGPNARLDILEDLFSRHSQIKIFLKSFMPEHFFQPSEKSSISLLNSLSQLLERYTPKPKRENSWIQAITKFKEEYCTALSCIQLRTNCYSHAVNNVEQNRIPGFKLEPGDLSGGKIPTQNLNPSDYSTALIENVLRDGALEAETALPEIKEGHYRIALYLSHTPSSSTGTPPPPAFHFVRENQDGTCSHKPGHLPVRTLRTAFPDQIVLSGQPYERKIFFQIPEGGLQQPPRPNI